MMHAYFLGGFQGIAIAIRLQMYSMWLPAHLASPLPSLYDILEKHQSSASLWEFFQTFNVPPMKVEN